MDTKSELFYIMIGLAGLALMNAAYDLLPHLNISQLLEDDGTPAGIVVLAGFSIWVGLTLKRDWAWTVTIILLAISLLIRGSIFFDGELINGWFYFYSIANSAAIVYLLLPSVRNKFVTDLFAKPEMPSSADKYSANDQPRWFVWVTAFLLVLVFISVIYNVFLVDDLEAYKGVFFIGFAIAGIALMESKRWAWLIAIGMVITSIALHVIAGFYLKSVTNEFIFILILNLLALVMLIIPRFRNYFRSRSS